MNEILYAFNFNQILYLTTSFLMLKWKSYSQDLNIIIIFILRMSYSPKSDQSFDKIQSTSRSSQSSGSDDQKKPVKFSKKVYQWASYLIATVLSILGFGLFVTYIPKQLHENKQFDFFVHCPAYYQLKKMIQTDTITNFQAKVNTPFGYSPQRLLDENQEELKRTYIVSTQDGIKLTNTQGQKEELRLRYCGFVRRWNETCEKGFLACSNPGPAFDVQENKTINVVWVNKINTNKKKNLTNAINNAASKSVNRCYSSNPADLCNKTGKTKQWQNLTFFDPTDLLGKQNGKQNKTGQVKVPTNFNLFPNSPHVHGLEVRPLFDGNPLSWFDNQKNTGVGFLSAEDDYFNLFSNKYSSRLLQYLGVFKQDSYKINVYRNCQQPGTLWYHDHTMGTTSFNVRSGLNSFYLIRNKTAEEGLPSGEYEKLIYMYEGMSEDTYALKCVEQCKDSSSPQKCSQCLQSSRALQQEEETLYTNTTYRFRILNGDFDKTYKDIRFLTVDSECKEYQFQVIGTDSSLRRKPVNNVTNITLAAAERADILITFPQNLPSGKIYVSSSQGILKSFNVIKADADKKKTLPAPLMVQHIQVPYVELREIKDEMIAYKRMRPLIRSSDSTFGINGHIRFHQGASENPQIGTIQDWYLINTISFGHPIHVHLIQFQIVEFGSLRVATFKKFDKLGKIKREYSCSYYQIDFFKKNSQINQNKPTSAQDVCQALKDNLKTLQYLKAFKNFANEHKKDGKNISGLDIMSTCTLEGDCKDYNIAGNEPCNWKPKNASLRYKYICNDITHQQLKQYQNGWKETVFVPAFVFTRIRIRWTSTDFDHSLLGTEKACERGYFHIPEETITEFPGYLYHCHILKHEDNQMMRPIMMQPSHCKAAQPWQSRYKQINQQIQSRQSKNRNWDLRR